LAELTAKERDLAAKVDKLKTEKQSLTVDPDGDMSDLGLSMQRVIDKMGTMDSRATAVDAVGPGPAQATPDARDDDPIRHLAELEAHRSVDEELARMRREIEPPASP
jgi:phage shock protein A